MKSHTLFGIGMTALLLGGFAAGGVTLASGKDTAAAVKAADRSATRASKALAKGRAAEAVTLAEAAVALAPQDAGYRLLLANSYLKAGRFASARAAYADVLSLRPDDGAAALNLALAQIAGGQWDDARATLTQHAEAIPARDRGLAWALAGDPHGAVEILMAAARTPGADARTRQNLGLALALSGRWREAKAVVLSDLSERQAQERLMQWIAFAKPVRASDQVAALLGVRAAEDAGLPAALALNAPVATAPAEVAANEPAPVATPETPAAEPVAVAEATPPADVAPAAPAAIVFAARQEVVQPLPARAAPTIRARGAFKTAATAIDAPTPAKGSWYVQLGAYDNAGVARDAWGRATRRYAAFAAHTPAGSAFRGKRGSFYRLSLGGFARADAVALCRGFRARGGHCFVRAGAGDQVASWVKPARTLQAKAAVRVGPKRKAVQVAAR